MAIRSYGPRRRKSITPTATSTTNFADRTLDLSDGSRLDPQGLTGPPSATHFGVSVRDDGTTNHVPVPGSQTPVLNTFDAMGGDYSAPTGSTTTGFVGDNSVISEHLPEQKIFPGVVQGRSQRSTTLSPTILLGEEEQPEK